MNRQPHSSLLQHLTFDKQIKIKHSQSGQYAQPNVLNQLNLLYKDAFARMQQIKFQFGQQSQQQYWTDSQYSKIAYIRMILNFFIDKFMSKNQSMEQSAQIKCEDCRNYQQYLQKLENDIRQHIRLEQQLKLYQESLEQKIQEQKKQRQKKLQYLQKLQTAIEGYKAKQNHWSQKVTKLQEQNQKMKQDFVKNKTDIINQHSHRANRQVSQSKSFRALRDMKQNTIIQRSSHKKEQKRQQKKEEKKQIRKSLQKRPSSSDRNRNLNVNSTKKFPLTEKVVLQKNKQERKKILQAKFEMRR